METMNISPEISKRTLERRNAMQEVFDKVEALTGTESNTQGKLDAAKKFLNEIIGKNDYRLEQAAAKLAEYYELELEVENRAGELERILPGALQRVAANDSHFSLDKKYKV